MPDNSFEHNISRQMGDFTFPASDAVWQKLEVNLQKRKKRRWAIIWFFSGLVLVTSGFYFFTRPATTNINQVDAYGQKVNRSESLLENADTSRAIKVIESRKIEPKKQLEPGAKVFGEIRATMETAKSKPVKDVIGGNEKGKPSSNITGSKHYNQHPEIVKIRSIGNEGQIEKEKFYTNKIDSESNISNEVKAVKKEEAIGILIAVTIPDSGDKKSSIENSVADSGSVNHVNNNPSKTDSLVIVKGDQKAQKTKRHLSFGLRFEAGRSANSESNFTKTQSADMVSGPSAGGPPVYSLPYTQEPSFGWSIGAWVRNPISQKVDIQTGLSYHNFRTRTTQGDSMNYANAFHLLSVPVEMVVQLNKGKKLPVQFQFGFEPGWMVGSNALFQDTSGFLYNDIRKFNRFQLGIQTGISFRFFQKTQHPLELGPVFQYMLTPAFKSGSAYDGHLNFLGLRADWKIFNIKSK